MIFVIIEDEKILFRNAFGGNFVSRIKKSNRSGIIHVKYCSQVLKCIYMKMLFFEVFTHLSIPQVIPVLLKLVFAWNLFSIIFKYCYNHVVVLKKINVLLFINGSYEYICNKTKRFYKFIDHKIIYNNLDNPMTHVSTMDANIIHHLGLRKIITL